MVITAGVRNVVSHSLTQETENKNSKVDDFRKKLKLLFYPENKW